MEYTAAFIDRLLDEVGTFLNFGALLVYDGAPPKDPNDEPTQQPLVVVPLPSPAFTPAKDGVMTGAPTDPTTVVGDGVAAFARLYAHDGVAVSTMPARAVDDPNRQPGDLLMSTTTLARGTVVSDLSLTFRFPTPSQP